MSEGFNGLPGSDSACQPGRGKGKGLDDSGRACPAAGVGSPFPPTDALPSPAHAGAAAAGPGAAARRGAGGRGSGSGALKFTQDNKSASHEEKIETLRALNSRLCEALRKVGRGVVAEKIAACHQGFNGWKCDAGHTWASPKDSCQVRLCAFDMRARRIRVLRQFEPVIAGLKDPRFAVLSERNVPLGQLAEGIDRLWESFERLRHTRMWKQKVRGAVAVLEITFNPSGSWHPHLNVILDGDYIPQRLLAGQWRRSTRGRGEIAWIARPRAVAEVFKYITKLADITAVPVAVAELLEAIHGARFIRTYGTLYNVPEPEAEKKPHVCPDCGSDKIQKLGPLDSGTVFVDGQGVFRFAEAWRPPAPEFNGWAEDEFRLWQQRREILEQKRLALVPLSAECAASGPRLFDAA